MARWDEDAVWEPEGTGQFDEDGEEFVDYVLAGSEPLSYYETMLYAVERVQLSLQRR